MRVLVVEDERPIADLVKLYLTRDGFGVHVEGDGGGGLSAARRLRPVLPAAASMALEGAELSRAAARGSASAASDIAEARGAISVVSRSYTKGHSD